MIIVSAHQGYPHWVDCGADFIEVDVRRTSSGVLVVSHEVPAHDATHVTLEEVGKAAGRSGIQLDLKESGYEVEVLEAALRRQSPARLVVTSPDYESLRAVKERFPEVRVGLTRQFVELTDADFLALDARHATADAIAFCARHEIPLWVWTVDDPTRMERFVDAGVAGLITNRPDLALRLRTARS